MSKIEKNLKLKLEMDTVKTDGVTFRVVGDMQPKMVKLPISLLPVASKQNGFEPDLHEFVAGSMVIELAFKRIKTAVEIEAEKKE